MLITFIGGGNMATALISGLKKSDKPGLSLRVCDPDEEARALLQASFDIETSNDPAAAVEGADIIVLAIKPQAMPVVLATLSNLVVPEQLVVSVAAGTTVSTISNQLGQGQAIVRAMPNTPALIGRGITGIFAGKHCKAHHLEQAEMILSATGKVVWIEDESLMDVVTAISGSGPAYYFLLTEALASAGEKLGLAAGTASQLAVHTCFGAGAMIVAGSEEVAALRHRVTSPGGTTEAALSVLESKDIRQLIFEAVEAATRKGRELAQNQGESIS